MTAVVQKWGNSLALRLPKSLANDAQIAQGTRVELVRTEEGVLLKTQRKPRYRLSALLGDITRRHLHGETDWGRPIGREMLK